MKQIAQTLTHSEASKIKSRIEGAGIPVIVSGEGSRNLFSTGLVSVWVAIDSQYHDAVIALDDPSHIAAQPINVEEFHETVKNTDLLPRFILDLNYPAIVTYACIAGFIVFVIRAFTAA
nr:hypothetical protein [uncultured Pseudomonas sp.]